MTVQLVLIRGLPGSGKSTLAQSMAGFLHVEADHFMTVDGAYKFDRSRLAEAHERCQRKTLWSLRRGLNVVVANTFTMVWEMQPYLDMGFPVRVIEATGEYENVHGVPRAAIERMRARWEAYP